MPQQNLEKVSYICATVSSGSSNVTCMSRRRRADVEVYVTGMSRRRRVDVEV
jgi:hypothetical protein